MSRNGCDHMNLNAESRMAARVRSDLATLATGCGRIRGGEDNFVKCDTVSYYNDIMSLNHLSFMPDTSGDCKHVVTGPIQVRMDKNAVD